MKKIHKLLPAVAMALAGAKVSAQVIYEPFSYTPTATTNSGGTAIDALASAPETEQAAPNDYKHYSINGTYWARRQNASTATFNSPSVLTGSLTPSAIGPMVL